MAMHSYLIPETFAAWKEETFPQRRPDYLEALGVTKFRCRDYGNEPVFLADVEVTDEQDTQLQTMPGVVALPDEATTLLDPALVTALEARGIPVTGSTVGELRAHLTQLFSVMQMFQGRRVNPIRGRALSLVLTAADVEEFARGGATVQEGTTLRDALLALAAGRVV